MVAPMATARTRRKTDQKTCRLNGDEMKVLIPKQGHATKVEKLASAAGADTERLSELQRREPLVFQVDHSPADLAILTGQFPIRSRSAAATTTRTSLLKAQN